MKLIRLSMTYIAEWFDDALWRHSRTRATGIWAAEDVYQEVLLRLSRDSFPALPTPSRFHGGRPCLTDPAMVLQAMRRHVQMICRHESYRLKTGEPEDRHAAGGWGPDEQAMLQEALRRLTDRQRRIVEARMWAGTTESRGRGPASLKEVSAVTGLSPATISRELAKAHASLSTALN